MAKSIRTFRIPNNVEDQQVFIIKFFGTNIITTVTSDTSCIDRWIQHHWSFYGERVTRLVVGLGVQWRPSYNHTNRLDADTLQLCIGTRCIIIQLSRCPYVPDILRQFLFDKTITFVGIQNNDDNIRLIQSGHDLNTWNLLDLGQVVSIATGERYYLKSSMKELVRYVLGFDGVGKDPSIGVSDWRAINLTPDQVEYAGVDAYVSFQIGKKVKAWDYHWNHR